MQVAVVSFVWTVVTKINFNGSLDNSHALYIVLQNNVNSTVRQYSQALYIVL
jgi:hypothetical protein